MKNIKILENNGINFDPFNHFQLSEVERQQAIGQHIDWTVSKIGQELRKTKQADHVLSAEQQKQREMLTYALFHRIKISSGVSTTIDSSLLRQGDIKTVAQLAYNKEHNPVNQASLSLVQENLPSRHQRAFFQICVLSGFHVERSILRKLGCHLEVRALTILDQMVA